MSSYFNPTNMDWIRTNVSFLANCYSPFTWWDVDLSVSTHLWFGWVTTILLTKSSQFTVTSIPLEWVRDTSTRYVVTLRRYWISILLGPLWFSNIYSEHQFKSSLQIVHKLFWSSMESILKWVQLSLTSWAIPKSILEWFQNYLAKCSKICIKCWTF